jgi:hypothetical protein
MDNIGPNIWKDGIQVWNILCIVTESAKLFSVVSSLINMFFSVVADFGGMKLL